MPSAHLGHCGSCSPQLEPGTRGAMAGGWSLGFQGFSRAQLLLTQRLGQWSVDGGVERPPRKGKRGPVSHPIPVAPGEGLRLPDQRSGLDPMPSTCRAPEEAQRLGSLLDSSLHREAPAGPRQSAGRRLQTQSSHPPGSPWVADGGLSPPQPGQTLLGWEVQGIAAMETNNLWLAVP